MTSFRVHPIKPLRPRAVDPSDLHLYSKLLMGARLADAHKLRAARKEYRCARQVYFDRLSPESREWHRATPCPHGGVIRPGDQYAETEGDDEFHPTRQHADCLEWTEPR